jgi:hypothetical protein
VLRGTLAGLAAGETGVRNPAVVVIGPTAGLSFAAVEA